MNKQSIYEGKAALYGQFINEWLLPFVPSGIKVLDVGCSFGLFGERLIKQKNCVVYGIDISKSAIEVAKTRLTDAACLDIENDAVPFFDQRFDLIVFADVLEHLVYPETVLLTFQKYLNQGGSFLISLPNIANVRYRVRHLFGRWNYQDGGILDRTHLHFYTKATARNLVLTQGLEIVKSGSTPGFDFLIGRLRPFAAITDRICLSFPRLFANQFIIVAKPTSV
jgi:2-polyprenyl-3-methyl-5-hydroxy-6-metoxy-1,4-benzoquinol methylase